MKHAYHHKDLRKALIGEAMVMLSESGIAALTLRELARRLGVTHTAPYAHYADKAALLADVANAGFALLADALESAKASNSDPRSALEAMSLAYVRFARGRPHLYRLMFVAEDLADDPNCKLSPESTRAFSALAGTVAALGPPANIDPRDLAVAAWAQVHGIAMLEIDRRMSMKTARSGEDIVAIANDVFVRGLRRVGSA
jgi:AcrR family transcriptional regulator